VSSYSFPQWDAQCGDQNAILQTWAFRLHSGVIFRHTGSAIPRTVGDQMQGLGGVVLRPESKELPAVGTVMVDTARSRVGEFRGKAGGRLCLRPVGGGVEWEVSPDFAREATQEEKLRAEVAAANGRTRKRRTA
jgi:hypothetical protein